MVEALLDPARVVDAIAGLEPRTAKLAHACTHTTFSPNVVHGGVKTNVIPDEVVLDVDIRTMPGETDEDVERYLADALGELAGDVEIVPIHDASAVHAVTRRHAAVRRHRRRASRACTRARRCCPG